MGYKLDQRQSLVALRHYYGSVYSQTTDGTDPRWIGFSDHVVRAVVLLDLDIQSNRPAHVCLSEFLVSRGGKSSA